MSRIALPRLWLPDWLQRLRAPNLTLWQGPTGKLATNADGGIIDATQEEIEECCCEEVVIEDCADLEACLGVVGGVITRTISVTLSGFVDDAGSSCEECTFLNDTYLFEDVPWEFPGVGECSAQGIISNIPHGDPLCQGLDLIVDIGFEHLAVTIADGCESWDITGAGAWDYISRLCNGEAISDLPYTGLTDDPSCPCNPNNSVTMTIQLL